MLGLNPSEAPPKPAEQVSLFKAGSFLLLEEATKFWAEPVMSFFLGMDAPLKILVDEDIKLNRQVSQLMLSRVGNDKEVLAMKGHEELDAMNLSSFELILMDIQIPLMNGFETTSAIFREYPEGQRPQIVALTANANPKNRIACMEAKMINYLTKSLRCKQLACLVQEVDARMLARPPRAPRNIMGN